VLVLAMGLAGAAGVTAAEVKPPLALETTIPLAGVKGRIDHMAIDLDRKRLIVAELGNNTVDIIDIDARTVVRRIEGLKEPQGVAYLKGPDRIAVTSAAEGTVRMFAAGDFSPAGRIDLGDDTDNLRVARDGRLVVGYGKGAVAWLDPARSAKLFDIPLAGHPEGFQLHPRDKRVFVNVPDARQIAVVDQDAGKAVAAWDTADMRSNFPLAISETGDTIATVFRNPPKLVLYDVERGAMTAQADTCGDSDDVFFNDKRVHLYVSCGSGAVEVFEQNESGLSTLGRVPTAPGARTSLFVPELDRLFVAARASGRSDAAVLVFRPTQ
jgi:DNA-binding beta-propeller fold protein YncE